MNLVPGTSHADRTPSAPGVGFSASPSTRGFDSWEKDCLQAEKALLRSRAFARETSPRAQVASRDKVAERADQIAERRAESAAASNGAVAVARADLLRGGAVVSSSAALDPTLAPMTVAFVGDRGGGGGTPDDVRVALTFGGSVSELPCDVSIREAFPARSPRAASGNRRLPAVSGAVQSTRDSVGDGVDDGAIGTFGLPESTVKSTKRSNEFIGSIPGKSSAPT